MGNRAGGLILLGRAANIRFVALTSSDFPAAGAPIPHFALPDVVSGRITTPSSFAGPKALVVAFICRHCPYVVHIMPTLLDLAAEYIPRSAAFAGICANDSVKYPDDSPDNLRRMALDRRFPFPVLHDESQETARAFGAVCTPEFFVYDESRRLFYHGRMDGSTPGNNIPCTGGDLRGALDALLGGRPAPAPQHPAMGCGIKWK